MIKTIPQDFSHINDRVTVFKLFFAMHRVCVHVSHITHVLHPLYDNNENMSPRNYEKEVRTVHQHLFVYHSTVLLLLIIILLLLYIIIIIMFFFNIFWLRSNQES